MPGSKQLEPGSFFVGLKSRLKPVLLGLELAVAGSPGEGDDVADVGHAGDKHEQTFKT